MKREKMYFEVGNEEHCYPLWNFQDRIRDGDKKIDLQFAKRDFGSGYMWCKAYQEIIDSGDSKCGKYCKHYKPRNKISGRCYHLDNSFISVGEVLILTKDGLTAKR